MRDRAIIDELSWILQWAQANKLADAHEVFRCRRAHALELTKIVKELIDLSMESEDLEVAALYAAEVHRFAKIIELLQEEQ